MPPLGTLKLPLNRRQFYTVTGGPFVECPETMVGVKMAAEITRKCAIDIPTRDFDVPERRMLYRQLNKAVDAILEGKPLYIGCMAGRGRTGLMMAILAKAFGVRKPVEYVRANYFAHAVETDKQYEFVKKLPITPTIRKKIKAERRRMQWQFWRRMFWKKSLTRMPKQSQVKQMAKYAAPVQQPSLDK